MDGSNVVETVQVEVRVAGDTDLTEVQRVLSDHLGRVAGLRVESVRVVKPFGMTPGEAALSFVISLVSSGIVHVYRNEIDAAVKRASEAVNAAMRTVHRTTPPAAPNTPASAPPPSVGPTSGTSPTASPDKP